MCKQLSQNSIESKDISHKCPQELVVFQLRADDRITGFEAALEAVALFEAVAVPELLR